MRKVQALQTRSHISRASCCIILSFVAILGFYSQLAHSAISRNIPAIGTIITVKGDEDIRFLKAPDWLKAEIDQALATGDALRTGPFGGLSILFRDETQLRVHRNTLLEILYMEARPGQGKGRLRLDKGAVWSRAHRGFEPEGVTFETPAATLAIRGTDWYLKVDTMRTTTLVVLDGTARFFNEFGTLQVNAGEIATAVIGQAPTKRILISPKDKPRWVLNLSLEWFNMLPMTGQLVGTLGLGRTQPTDPLERAERLYDRGDYAAAALMLNQLHRNSEVTADDSLQSSRIDELRGFLLIRQHRFKEAEPLLKRAATKLKGRQRLVALLGSVGIYVETGRLQQASAALKGVEQEFRGAAEVGMSRAWLHAFAGEYDAAIAEISAVRVRFPTDARAAVVAAQIYLLTDESEHMHEAITTALAIDPGDFLGWHWKGLFYQQVELNAELAKEAYQRALKLNPRHGSSWNNLGVLHLEIGEYGRAEAALRKAIAIDPKEALFEANFAIFLDTQERLAEAEQVLAAANALDPNQSGVLAGRGVLALKRGLPNEGVDWLLEANVADPNWPGGDVLLGEGLYQGGRVEAAQQTLSNAARLDPNDPLPPLVSSIIAQDRAQAGEAIQSAREAYDRLSRTGPPLEVETIASSQTGITNVGSAYANLDLNDWGTY